MMRSYVRNVEKNKRRNFFETEDTRIRIHAMCGKPRMRKKPTRAAIPRAQPEKRADFENFSRAFNTYTGSNFSGDIADQNRVFCYC